MPVLRSATSPTRYPTAAAATVPIRSASTTYGNPARVSRYAAMRPSAVRISTLNERGARIRSFAAARAEQAMRAKQQHERHRSEQHHVRVAWIDHRGEADDLARDEATEHCAGERTDSADHDDNEGLHQDRFAHVRRE